MRSPARCAVADFMAGVTPETFTQDIQPVFQRNAPTSRPDRSPDARSGKASASRVAARDLWQSPHGIDAVVDQS